MTLTTNTGKTFNVNWAWSVFSVGTMMAELASDMTVEEVGKQLDGITHFHTSDENEGERDHDGYVRIIRIIRDPAKNTVQITWDKGGDP